MMKIEKCRRGHKLDGRNVMKQSNTYEKAGGGYAEYVTTVCRACKRYRAKKNAAGEKFRDLRTGVRA